MKNDDKPLNMIAAQVALNYGLFCDTMVFHGLYDNIDRRFIRDTAENTAQEIYVKKFLVEDLKSMTLEEIHHRRY